MQLDLSKPSSGTDLSIVLPSLPIQDMNNLEEGVEFLPAMNTKKMEKRGPKRRVVVTILIIAFLLISLVTGLLVWHFKCECDVKLMWGGGMHWEHNPAIVDLEELHHYRVLLTYDLSIKCSSSQRLQKAESLFLPHHWRSAVPQSLP